jgi:uncharacterized secreted protein with C-terminal beta-propeller domain
MRIRVALAGLVLAAVVALAALPAPATAARGKPRLKAFESCEGLVGYARSHALRHPGGLISPRRPGPETMPAPAPDGAPVPVNAPEAEDDHSTTNVQEGGVDEPDTVKTDGRRLFVAAAGSLRAIDVRTPAPRMLGSLALPEGYSHELLLREDRVLALSQLGPGIADGIRQPDIFARPRTLLSEIDVSDPTQMRVRRTLEVDGSYVSARLTGKTARVVITSSPRALETTVENIRASRLPAWMPRATLTRAGGARSIRRLVRCRAVRRTRAFTGLDMVSLLTIDLERGLPAVDADALMTSAETVYASPKALYIATRRWFAPQVIALDEPPPGLMTAIHRFDTSDREKTVYRSSGEVRGFLLSQWALSEHAGHLRVASTDEPDWWGGADGESASRVTVLREDGRRLDEVGRVGGLGRGERIYAVRFIGDVGYVVTFRQVDPLYTLSLQDPTNPRVLGELKVLGYSAYLHPIGDDLLLGIGQDATEAGRLKGTQLSVFDVSDPSAPRRLHQRALAAGSSSAVEWDHRAFLYWPATKLAVVPVDGAAAGFTVGRQGVDAVGEVKQPGTIDRSAVAAGRLLTISDAGVTSSRLTTLDEPAWLSW